MTKATVRVGDFIECNPEDRDVLRRVAIVGQVNEYHNPDAWYFDAVQLAVKPEDGEFYSVSTSSFNGKEEGRLWRKLGVDEGWSADEAAAFAPEEVSDGMVGL
jgi:hypothetical protein